jgi:putative nucleotidyltransferase with HDIG domain
MNDFSAVNGNDEFLELDKQFSLDELDDWRTTAGLVEAATRTISTRIAGATATIFVHAPEAHEYREIDREGLAAIPEDSLFIGCLAMQNAAIDLASFFTEYALDDLLLQELLSASYRGQILMPIVHRFNMLAFILLSTPAGKLSDEERHVLTDIAGRLKINLYAASIADRRQRELLKLAEYPAALHRHADIRDLTRNLLEDLGKEIAFDSGVYYQYDEYFNQLVPVVWRGTETVPARLNAGRGISGQAIERKRAIFVPDRKKHPSFSLIGEEPFITGSFISAPILTDKRIFGVVTLSRNEERRESFGVEHRYTLEIAAAFIATEINNRLLYDELEQSYFSTVAALTRALEAKDHYTRGHSERVMKYAVGIAQTLGLSPDAVRKIRYGAILHDIGKIGISDSIITKPSKLTDMEFAEIKKHTEIGYDIVNENGFFGEIRDLIRYHHEKMDGTGYYAKQNGDYPWEAMIISLADIYDALASDRPYRTAFSTMEAMDALEHLVGINFDERIFSAFRTWIANTPELLTRERKKTKIPSRI